MPHHNKPLTKQLSKPRTPTGQAMPSSWSRLQCLVPGENSMRATQGSLSLQLLRACNRRQSAVAAVAGLSSTKQHAGNRRQSVVAAVSGLQQKTDRRCTCCGPALNQKACGQQKTVCRCSYCGPAAGLLQQEVACYCSCCRPALNFSRTLRNSPLHRRTVSYCFTSFTRPC
jgi:hypothetical protein